GDSIFRSPTVWYGSECGSGIQIREILEPAGNVGIRVRYVNSKLRAEIFVRDGADTATPKIKSTNVNSTPEATILREIISDILLQAVWPGASQVFCFSYLRLCQRDPRLARCSSEADRGLQHGKL